MVAVAGGPLLTAVVFAAVAVGAAGQAARSWKGSGSAPHRPVAIVGAAACALAGGVGPYAVALVAAAVILAALTARWRVAGGSSDQRITLAIALVIGVGAAAPALARDALGLVPALVLVAAVHAVDASTFIVGSGARSRWEGPAAGAASVAALSLAVAAVFVPPFRGASPWVLGALVAVLAPVGPLVASALIGRKDADVPALRRLDAYLVVAPVWTVAGRLLLDLPT